MKRLIRFLLYAFCFTILPAGAYAQHGEHMEDGGWMMFQGIYGLIFGLALIVIVFVVLGFFLRGVFSGMKKEKNTSPEISEKDYIRPESTSKEMEELRENIREKEEE